jgi:hypothetical protein
MKNKLTSLTGFGEGDPKPESFSKQVRIGKEAKRIAKSAESKGMSAVGWRGDAKKYGHAAAKSKALSKKSGSAPKFKWDHEHPKGEAGAIRERQDATWKKVMARGKPIDY